MHKIALIGRPNVGKSTLFNRLIRSNRAITHDRPGVTRDRMEGVVRRAGREFGIIDTGGVTLAPSHSDVVTLGEAPDELRGFEQAVLEQASAAMAAAVAIALVVDAREGLTPLDEHLAAFVRRSGKPILLVLNKVDGPELADGLSAEFHVLGLDLAAVSAEHGFGLAGLEEALIELLPAPDNADQDAVSDFELGFEPGAVSTAPDAAFDAAFDSAPDAASGAPDALGAQTGLRLAMLGRPNVGKSSLVNALVGEERMIVSNIPGTTRDSVDVTFEHDGARYTFVDTAGVRRRTKITDSVERFSVNSAIKSSTKAQVTLLVFDVLESPTTQDKRLLALLDERKIPFMVLLNKMDMVPKAEAAKALRDVREALAFCKHVPLIRVSAHSGEGLGQILPMADLIRKECTTRIPTAQLNRAFAEILDRNQPPIVRNARPKFFYLTQAESDPPTFVFFVSDAERIKPTYARYLEKSLRAMFNIKYAPVRVHFRSSHKK